MQLNEDYRLQTKGKIREKTAGNTSALVDVRRNLFNMVKMFAMFFSCSNRKVCLLIKEYNSYSTRKGHVACCGEGRRLFPSSVLSLFFSLMNAVLAKLG